MRIREVSMRLWVVFGFLACSTISALAQGETNCPTPRPSVMAGFDKAQDLKDMSDRDLATYVRGFVAGVLLAPMAGARATCGAQLLNCVRDRNDKQMMAILRKHLLEHPEEWHLPAN